MADSTVSPSSLAGGFADDAEAQSRFAARQHYLAWRRRLLPVLATLLLLLMWW